ncbi:CAP domain-containing protein [Rubrobacter indicoceani]|uniref:CAP domain-containing protein n=1 Tax=Rubrobacter indicoceani TaxID=2051957 RepID=UPI000E5ACB31|nr:CAP domain-containing protein [Rubrobacter indicoceani]
MNDGVTGSGEKRPEASGRKTPYLVFLLLLLTLFVLASVLPFPANQGRADTAYDAEELEFLDRINAYRAENGLGELVLSDDLTVAAERHNRDMGGFRFFAHDTAQSFYYAPGSEPWDRMAAEGYSYNAFKGENLAAGYETADEAFAAWKASPSHNSAMLDGNYKVVGVSRLEVPGSPFGWYWTTDFGSFVDPSARTEAPVRSTEAGERRDRPSENTVRNGSFVGAEFWEQSAKDEAKLILRGQFVRMGGYDNGSDEVRQGIKVRPDAVLRYDFKVSSVGDGDPEDSLTVRLTDNRGRPVAALKRYNGGQETDWKRQRVDLSDYAGQDLYLSFVSRTDAERDSYFYLDDVSITP